MISDGVAAALGTVGVGLLLTAFLLNAAGRMRHDSRIYLFLNILGAALSSVYALLLNAIPFVVLEGAWAAVAAHRLVNGVLGSGQRPSQSGG